MDNILKPDLVWVEDRCYRFTDSNVWSSEDKTNTPYYEPDDYQAEFDEINSEICDNQEIDIEQTSDGKYRHEFHAPKVFYGFIVGYKGYHKKKLESETKTSIWLPKQFDKKNERISITGSNRSSVISCRKRIDLLIESSRTKIPFTHFVSVPLGSSTIVDNFKKFKQEVLSNDDIKRGGLIEDYFVTDAKLHLTIAMLRLLSDKEINEAKAMFTDCINTIVEPFLMKNGQIPISIRGIDCMNDDPSSISVLYGKIQKNDKLQDLADRIFQFFVQKGLSNVQYTDKVKLHMTLIKTSRAISQNQRNKSADKFDATKIFQKFRNFHFGETELSMLNICSRGVETKDGGYQVIISKSL